MDFQEQQTDDVHVPEGTPATCDCEHHHALESLIRICEKGSPDDIEMFFSCNLKNTNGDSPLIACARNPDKRSLKLLLKSKLFWNECENQAGEVPLHVSARAGIVANVKLLLQNGAFVEEATDHCASTPIQMAANSGMWETVETLMEHGANIYSRNLYDQSVLTFVARSENINIAEKVCDKGADPQKLLIEALRIPVAAHFFEALLSAFSCIEPNALLKEAIRQQNEEAVSSILLLRNIDVNVHQENDHKPIVEACRHGNEKVVSLLLARGAEDASNEEFRCVHASICSGNKRIFNCLKTAGFNMWPPEPCVHPLQWAIRLGRSDWISHLINEGAPIAKLTVEVEQIGLKNFELLAMSGFEVSQKRGELVCVTVNV